MTGKEEPQVTGKRSLWFRQINLYSQVSFAFASAMAVSLGIGYGLDQWRGTEKTYLTLFFVLGIVAGLKSMLRTIREIHRSLDGSD